MVSPLPVFDGHNDVLLRLASPSSQDEFLTRRGEGHLDLVRAREAGFVGGLFACYTPSQEEVRPVVEEDGSYRTPFPDTPDLSEAQSRVLRMASTLFSLERRSQGAVRVCTEVAHIRECVATGALAAVFHIEGAEALGEDLDELYVFHRLGLRSLGPVWSRPNRFGEGVPFAYPSSPDTGPGLTAVGKELVRLCNRLGIMVDLSHLNEKGFWDVAALSDRPLVASHSNAHAICAHSRNLTDRQLDAIAETGGLVGINFAVKFLHPEGRGDLDMPLSVIVRHVDHLIERLGVNGVALGSDFDGCTVARAMGDVTGVSRLIQELRAHGYDEETLRRICLENWLDVLERTWTLE